MKSAYELAMERLAKSSPSVKLSAAQKAALADLESRHKAKLAERELSLKDSITAARNAGKLDEAESLQQEWVAERRKLESRYEADREAIRKGK